jgi:hypothetical protein
MNHSRLWANPRRSYGHLLRYASLGARASTHLPGNDPRQSRKVAPRLKQKLLSRTSRRRYSRPTLQCASEAALIGKGQVLSYFAGAPPGDTDSVGVGVARFRQSFRASYGQIGAPFMAILLVNGRRTATVSEGRFPYRIRPLIPPSHRDFVGGPGRVFGLGLRQGIGCDRQVLTIERWSVYHRGQFPAIGRSV